MNELALRGKLEELKISLQNIYSALNEDDDLRVQAEDNILTDVIK